MSVRGQRLTSIGVLVALIVMSGCSGSGDSRQSSTGTAKPQQFTPLKLGLPQKALSAPVTGQVPDGKTLHVNVALKVSETALKKLGGNGRADAKQNAQNLAQQLGVSAETVQQVEQYLAGAHIQATTSKTRTSVSFDVKAGVAAKLLQTRFVTHQMDNRTYFTPDPKRMPQIPADIAPHILAVNGLESFSTPPGHRSAVGRPLTSAVPQTPKLTATGRAAKRATCGRFPAVAATHQKVAASYGYDKLWQQGFHGENMTINLVEMDGYDQADVANYIACTNSRTTIQKVSLGAASPPAEGETTLDMEMIAGLAPNARIVDYEEDPALLNGSGTDSWMAFNAALQRIIDDNSANPRPGSIVSISLGGVEGLMSRDILQAVDQNLRIITQALHMTVFVASGDCGAFGTRMRGALDVSFPASSPWAVGVGGTKMMFGPNGARTQETVWSDGSDMSRCHNQWGSGGGLSHAFQRPWYQQGSGVANQYSTGGRQVPDVSAAAINLPVFFRGAWHGFGGTSAAAPIWAAGLSLVNQGLITRKRVFVYGPDTMYHLSGRAGAERPYYDVTTGNNLYYPATPGWDYSTGLGTPYLPSILNTLMNNPG